MHLFEPYFLVNSTAVRKLIHTKMKTQDLKITLSQTDDRDIFRSLSSNGDGAFFANVITHFSLVPYIYTP